MKKNLLIMIAAFTTAALVQTNASAQNGAAAPAAPKASSAIVNTTLVNVTLAEIMGTVNPATTPGTGTNTENAGKNDGGNNPVGTTTGPDGTQINLTNQVDFNYDVYTKYKQSQSVSKPGAINVFSSVPYKITVRAANAVLKSGGPDVLDAKVIEIEAKLQKDASYTNAKVTNLGIADTDLVTGQKETEGTIYDLNYTISAENASKFVSKAKTTYSVVVFYTIAAI